jgi:hypothetical protein
VDWLPQKQLFFKKKRSPLPWPLGPIGKRIVVREALTERAILCAYSVVAYMRFGAVKLKLCVVSMH